MRGAGVRAAALLAVVALTAGGCSGDGGPAAPDPRPGPAAESPATPPASGELPPVPDEFTEQTLTWEPCPPPGVLQGSGEAPGAEWECAELTVPVDYAHPDNGETLAVAVVRARSTVTQPAGRIGSLVFNFGGPGGSGVATLPRVADRYTTLRGGYDLVSFDPRGVGASEGVVCRTDAETDAAAQRDDGPPRTPAEERELLADAREYAAACQARAGALLPHLTTENTARDLDLLRAALGDGRLHYFGISYGTKLGAVYAHLFPERVGRAVFDSVVDPTRDLTGRALLQTEGFQLALDNYLADCARAPGCPTGPEGGPAAYGILTGLLDALRERPLPTASGRDLTAGLALTAWLSMLYSESSWPALTEALEQALDQGRGDLLLAAAERYNGRDAQGRYRNIHAANNAINCADFRSRPTAETVRARADAFAAASPVFGESLVWSLLSCAYWPVTGERDRPEVSAPGARPILLLATTGDPATPYAGAARMRDALGGDAGVLLTFDGEGHGAYSGGSACVTDAVHAHLLAGTTPADGTVCE